MLHGRFLFASPPCIPDLHMAKDFKASIFHVFELSIAFPWIPNNYPQSHIALVIKKAIKTPKLNINWLEVLAKVLNMLIGLKGNNYYSKVFKRVNYKLWNNTFWVIIIGPVTTYFHSIVLFPYHVNSSMQLHVIATVRWRWSTFRDWCTKVSKIINKYFSLIYFVASFFLHYGNNFFQQTILCTERIIKLIF